MEVVSKKVKENLERSIRVESRNKKFIYRINHI